MVVAVLVAEEAMLLNDKDEESVAVEAAVDVPAPPLGLCRFT